MCTVSLRKGMKVGVKSTRCGIWELDVISYRVTSGDSRNIKFYTCFPIYIQQECNVSQFTLSGKCSTCFGWYLHPSSGTHTTVSTASDICNTVRIE